MAVLFQQTGQHRVVGILYFGFFLMAEERQLRL